MKQSFSIIRVMIASLGVIATIFFIVIGYFGFQNVRKETRNDSVESITQRAIEKKDISICDEINGWYTKGVNFGGELDAKTQCYSAYNKVGTLSTQETTNKIIDEVANSTEEHETKVTETFKVKPVDTKDWLTYRNEKFGYTIQYPINSKLGTTTDQSSMKISLYDALGLTFEDPMGKDYFDENALSFVIRAYVPEKQITLDAWIADLGSYRQAPTPKIKKKIIVDGEDSYYIEYDGRPFGVGDYTAVKIYTIHNGVQYTLNGSKVPNEMNAKPASYNAVLQYEPYYDAMLKSFKFTE